MQMVMRTLGVLFVALIFAVVFAPKKELYYALEHRLARNGLTLANEAVHSGPNSLEIRHATLLYEGAPLATFDGVTIRTWIFWSQAVLSGLHPQSGMERIIPVSIEKAHANHTLWNPKQISLDLNGSFGTATGVIDLQKRNIKLQSPTAGKIESLRPYLKKNDEGKWIYESTF